MKTLVLAAIVLAGCSPQPPRELLCECFARAAYDCVVAESRPQGDGDSPEKPCCGECNGTGKVLSGDRLALVDCECDPSCSCKSGKSCPPGGECEQSR